jgi:pimeloyl-ACP methyl ester carboxylesterase
MAVPAGRSETVQAEAEGGDVALQAKLDCLPRQGLAWQSKPSWYIVATEDRTIQPELERFVAKRMGATTVELRSSHVPMLSQPQAVLDVIRNAAQAVQKSKAA